MIIILYLKYYYYLSQRAGNFLMCVQSKDLLSYKIKIIKFAFRSILMSKNILQKFRKSLQQSSKIVYDSGVYSHRSSTRRSQLEPIKQYGDRMQNQQSRPSFQQSQQLLKRIPILLSQNDELREKIKELESQLQRKNKEKDAHQKRSYKGVKTEPNSEYENRFAKYQSDCSSGSSMIGGRLYQSLRIGSRWDSIDQKLKANTSYSYHSLQKRSDLAQLQTQIVKFLEKKIDELRTQNNELQIKYNDVLSAKKHSSEEIDKIKQNFQTTLINQTQVFKKNQDFYVQKIKTLEANILKISEEYKLVKMHNQNLCEKLVDLQLALSKLNYNSRDMIISYKNKCVREKQKNLLNEEIGKLWSIKQAEYFSLNHLLQTLKISKDR